MMRSAERVWRTGPSAGLASLMSRLTDDSILSGPDRAPDDYYVDDILASTFKEALNDLMVDHEIDPQIEGYLPQAINQPLNAFASDLFHNGQVLLEVPQDEIRIVSCETGVLLLQSMAHTQHAKICGMLSGSTLAIDPISGLRGLGYGRDLVIARLIQDEALPTWDHDKPGYSYAGAQTVRAAHSALLSMECENRPSEGM